MKMKAVVNNRADAKTEAERIRPKPKHIAAVIYSGSILTPAAFASGMISGAIT